MTAVGKILVFLNLVFSLVVGAFVIMIYLARTHWVDTDKKLRNENTVLAASARTYQAEAQKAQQDAAVEIGKIRSERDNVQKDLDAAKTASAELRGELDKLRTQHARADALATKQGVEVEKRQDDVAKLRDTLRKRDQEINTLVLKNAELTNEATVAKIERQSVQDQNGRLEAQLQQMAKDVSRMRGSGGAATARAGGKNPPPENVEGLVQRVDATSSSGILMSLTIGSDAGLAKGHTLELFRLNPASPMQSKYLGTVRIVEADAKQAVAQPVGRLTDKPRPGDSVASRILGGS
ncbi:MAG TPA: hypothetical protein VMG10_18440 [Gemmataceae bacterium]|nr:hypothetical protein [Gemmataceae bacterium]